MTAAEVLARGREALASNRPFTDDERAALDDALAATTDPIDAGGLNALDAALSGQVHERVREHVRGEDALWREFAAAQQPQYWAHTNISHPEVQQRFKQWKAAKQQAGKEGSR